MQRPHDRCVESFEQPTSSPYTLRSAPCNWLCPTTTLTTSVGEYAQHPWVMARLSIFRTKLLCALSCCHVLCLPSAIGTIITLTASHTSPASQVHDIHTNSRSCAGGMPQQLGSLNSASLKHCSPLVPPISSVSNRITSHLSVRATRTRRFCHQQSLPDSVISSRQGLIDIPGGRSCLR